MRLANKVVVITGAGAGLGRDSALLFAREGANVVVADLIAERAESTVEAVEASGGVAVAVQIDVTKEAQVASAIELALDRFGKLDVMYNNAGIPTPGMGGAFEDTTEEAWRAVIDVNLMGVFFGCKHAVRPMRASGGGSIINTSSAGALVGYPGCSPYSASKGGVNALTRNLALDLGADNIRVNAICPAIGMAANTNFLLPVGSAVRSEAETQEWDPVARGVPLHAPRPPLPLDSAHVALFLASDESMYLSGLAIPIDGGQLSRVPGVTAASDPAKIANTR